MNVNYFEVDKFCSDCKIKSKLICLTCGPSRYNFVKKENIKMENKEVNFIEMMKDSAENGTVYRKSNCINGTTYKVLGNILTCKSHMGDDENRLCTVDLIEGKYIKVEQYKEITAEEALKVLREGKRIEFEYSGITGDIYKSKPLGIWGISTTINGKIEYNMDAFISALIMGGKFYIKE